jgi:hypothetical protein
MAEALYTLTGVNLLYSAAKDIGYSATNRACEIIEETIDQISHSAKDSTDSLCRTIDGTSDQICRLAKSSTDSLCRTIDGTSDQISNAAKYSTDNFCRKIEGTNDQIPHLAKDSTNHLCRTIDGTSNQISHSAKYSTDHFCRTIEWTNYQISRLAKYSTDYLCSTVDNSGNLLYSSGLRDIDDSSTDHVIQTISQPRQQPLILTPVILVCIFIFILIVHRCLLIVQQLHFINFLHICLFTVLPVCILYGGKQHLDRKREELHWQEFVLYENRIIRMVQFSFFLLIIYFFHVISIYVSSNIAEQQPPAFNPFLYTLLSTLVSSFIFLCSPKRTLFLILCSLPCLVLSISMIVNFWISDLLLNLLMFVICHSCGYYFVLYSYK